ncbi:3-dehydroquinate synthase [Telmatospirillum siberiense]|uniref:3-dehydroquinate synthase n=1 Tax=Telmatospirillum siberiense TaxID=382514 RepID=A0A2N3PZT2_9PROT|nr:3-dehydroquinate synthase [Telmatospirillum siberiense]PKU25906.1 3-dehydroquinate synthase [Telmatospirillum siberiense]
MFSRPISETIFPIPADRASVAEEHRYSVIRQELSVSYDYPVYFTRRVFDPANPVLVEALTRLEPARRQRFVLITDTGIATHIPTLVDDVRHYEEHHASRISLAGAFLLPGGEACKNDGGLLGELETWLHANRMDRQSHVVIVGGGAVLDMAGYAAAIAHRGLRTTRLPTTVLAQGDSGVGVKTAVNAFGAKNYRGVFAPPFAVINDLAFIDILPPRDRTAGMAEAVKVAAIRDYAFFLWLESAAGALATGDRTAMEIMIRRMAGLHLKHIATAGDPFEFGSARPLDFGHWAAHKLETLTDHRLRHGEAVAIGIALDSLYSAQTGLLDADSADRLCRLLRRLGFRLWDTAIDLRGATGRRCLIAGLAEFREHLGGDLTITLLAALGQGIEVHRIEEDRLEAAIADLRCYDEDGDEGGPSCGSA